MTKTSIAMVTIIAAGLAVVGGREISAQDKYAVQVPNGLSMSAFRGYEDWQLVSIAQTNEVLNAVVANPTMIDAYRNGIPGNGKPFPDGSKIAKIQWRLSKSVEAPFDVNVPDTLKDVAFIEKDSKRFTDTGGWGYALFDYDAASDTFKPNGTGVGCGHECHKIAAAKDYIFHPYQKR